MIKGTISKFAATGDMPPVANVNIYYENDTKVGTTSNKKGEYSIPFHKDKGRIIFSCQGFAPDYLTPVDGTTYDPVLEEGVSLPVVEVKESMITKATKNNWWKWVLMILIFGVTITTITYVTKKAIKK